MSIDPQIAEVLKGSRPFIYASLCDGIGAVHVAWQPLGWRCAWTSEIEPFPIAVVDYHWHLPNLGDMTRITDEQIKEHGPVDLVVGGTPCQSFSVAGLRKGMADPRGNLALVFLGLVDRIRPEWVVWENVPGVLSSGDGRDFGSFLGALGQLGYGWAYRVLDAQYVRVGGYERAVPQRRRRVFVVGCAGDSARAAAVLFDAESLRGDSPPCREAGKSVAGSLENRARGGGFPGTHEATGGYVQPVAYGGNNTSGPIAAAAAVNAGGCKRIDFESETFVAGPLCSCGPTDRKHGHGWGQQDFESGYIQPVVHSLRADGFDASEDGTGRGTPLVPMAVDLQNTALGSDVAGTLDTTRPTRGGGQGVLTGVVTNDSHPVSTDGSHCPTLRVGTGLDIPSSPAVAFQTRIARNGRGQPEEVCPTLQGAGAGATSDMRPCVAVKHDKEPKTGVERCPTLQGADGGSGVVSVACETTMDAPLYGGLTSYAVRRLTPLECERLQAFPDGYTAVPYRGKPAADGPRYRALGNSMACNCMRWIGTRIQMVEGSHEGR